MGWESSNQTRKHKTTITSLDYSVKTGFIAVGGVEGKIALFDPSAKILTAHASNHAAEILDLYFYDKQT